ncbi:hypothetical protein FRB91_005800 [Serendipita sp. 411]|nr:hypothetical protein FRB91_005800 [Serendipita sp. 411]
MSRSSIESSPAPQTRIPHHHGVLFATFCEPANFGNPEVQALAKSHPQLFDNDAIIPVGCRIVVTRRGMRSFFTFVPLAHGPGGVSQDDRIWPPEGRKVDVLGVLTNLMQDDWEAYKIDPQYYCFLPADGSPPYVRKREDDSMVSDSDQPRPTVEPMTPERRPFTKRTGSLLNESEDISPRKRHKTTVESATETDSDEKIHGYEATRAKLKRQNERGRKTKSSSFSRMGDMANDLPDLFTFSDARSPSPTAPRKEKVAMETDPTQTKRSFQNGESDLQGAKRQRLSSQFLEIDEKVRRAARLKREYISNRHRGYQRATRSQQNESDFWQDVNFEQFKGQSFPVEPEPTHDPRSETSEPEIKVEEEPPLASSRNPIVIDDSDDDVQRSLFDDDGGSYGPNRRPGAPKKNRTEPGDHWDEPFDSDEERLARLEESRRKLEELNSHDRARMEAKRRADEGRRRAMEELRRRREREEQAEQARRKREQARADRERRREEERQSKERQERQERQRFGFSGFGTDFERDPYSGQTRGSGRVNFEWFENLNNGNRRASTSTNANRWTPTQALERYNKLSEKFDNFKGTPENPVPPLDQVPWPVLFQPPFRLDQVDWTAVEKFFENAEVLMAGRTSGKKQWKEFLKTSTRRFHPDRWRARGLIGERGWGNDVEEKVNHVSKVLTPLYRALD